MTNALKGEVSFELPDGGGAFRLAFSIDALCILEERLDMSVGTIAATLGNDPRLGFLRTVFWAGLQTHHPKVTEKAAGEMIGLVKIDRAAEMIGQAMVAAFPSAEAAEGEADPQKADAGGIGQPSSASGLN